MDVHTTWKCYCADDNGRRVDDITAYNEMTTEVTTRGNTIAFAVDGD